MDVRATGRCLCGAVRYKVRGLLRDVVLCHCEECRRWGGYVGAFAATRVDDLALLADDALRWIDSPQSDHGARRAYCIECGSNLFWQAAGAERIGIVAGTLDQPTGLRLAAHIYTQSAADYDELPEDGIPRDPGRDEIELRWT